MEERYKLTSAPGIVFELVHKNLIVAEDLFTHFHLGEPGTVYRWTGDLMNTWNTCLKVQGAGSPDHQDVLAYAAANDTIFDLVQNQLVWRLLCEITAYDAMAAKPTQIEAIAKSLKSPHIQVRYTLSRTRRKLILPRSQSDICKGWPEP